jgi:hypothetical protein
MNYLRLLEPSYVSIGPGLNLSGQVTCLGLGAKALNVPLQDGVAARAGERQWGDGDLAVVHLLSSMMLHRSS